MCSPTEVSALVPTNACRHGKLLDKHAVRDDQPLRAVVDVRTAIGHYDMRGVNEASSERDYAMHRTYVTAALCCTQFLSPDGNKHPTDTSLPPPHESRQKYNLDTTIHQGGNVDPSIAFCSHRRREDAPLFATSSRDRHVHGQRKITSQSRPSSLNRRSCIADDDADSLQRTAQLQNDPHHINQTLGKHATSMTTSRPQDCFARQEPCEAQCARLPNTRNTVLKTHPTMFASRKKCRPEKPQQRRLLLGRPVNGPTVRQMPRTIKFRASRLSDVQNSIGKRFRGDNALRARNIGQQRAHNHQTMLPTTS